MIVPKGCKDIFEFFYFLEFYLLSMKPKTLSFGDTFHWYVHMFGSDVYCPYALILMYDNDFANNNTKSIPV